MTEIVHNVRDGRRGYIGAWVVAPLNFESLTPADYGRTVIYRDFGRAEAGTLTAWRDGVCFAKYSRGDTSAGAKAEDLVFGIKALDTAEEIHAALIGEKRGET